MSIEKNYTKIPDKVLFNSELNIYERVVLMYLIKKNNINKGNRFFEYNSKMQRMLAMSDSTIKRCTKALREKGYINIDTEKNTNYFTINWNKIEGAREIPFNSDIPSGYTGLIVDMATDTNTYENNINSKKRIAAVEQKPINTTIEDNEPIMQEKNNDKEVFYKLNKMQDINGRLYWKNELKSIVSNEQLARYRELKLVQFYEDEHSGKPYIYFNTDEYPSNKTENKNTSVENSAASNDSNTTNIFDNKENLKKIQDFDRTLLPEQRKLLWGIRSKYKAKQKQPIEFNEYFPNGLNETTKNAMTFLKNAELIKAWISKIDKKTYFKPIYKGYIGRI